MAGENYRGGRGSHRGGTRPPQNPVNTSEMVIRSRGGGRGQGQSRSSHSESSATASERGTGPEPGPSQPRNLEDVVLLDAKDLTMAAFPKVEYENKRHTQSSGIHKNLTFCANLEPWRNFQNDVRQVFNEFFENWDSKRSNTLSVELKYPPANAIAREHYLCGEELSSSGRYVHHVLHVMTAVGKELGINVLFGDWYTSYERQARSGTKNVTTVTTASENQQGVSDDGTSLPATKRRRKEIIPDYAVLVNEKHGQTDSFARALGEAKGPYQHDFKNWLDQAEGGDNQKLRELFGTFPLISSNLQYCINNTD